jgi:cytochrome c-type biogenesis protein CcmH
MPAAPAAALAKAAPPAAPAGKSVSGVVTIAPEVASKITGTDTLFVFARAEGGPRAPLAVLRGSAKQLPLRFALDDTMAMSPQWSLSRASDVRIEARVSKSGNAAPQSGDVVGTSDVVKPGAKDVRIVIDKVLP